MLNMPPLRDSSSTPSSATRDTTTTTTSRIISSSDSRHTDACQQKHTSDFSAKKDHPTSYEERPKFLGPLKLTSSGSSSTTNTLSFSSTSDIRRRIKHYYLEQQQKQQLQQQSSKNILLKKKVLSTSSSTNTIIKAIVDHFACNDAPIDVKELAESIEFYLRCRKRLLGAAKVKIKQKQKKTTATATKKLQQQKEKYHNHHHMIEVYDLCSGHGLTGMLFAACNPPRKHQEQQQKTIINTILVDKVEPPSHKILRNLISDVCPWILADSKNDSYSSRKSISNSNSSNNNNNIESYSNTIKFNACSLEELSSLSTLKEVARTEDYNEEDCSTTSTSSSCSKIVIATHACGKLTDYVLNEAVEILDACSIAVMPCCYTGTDKGSPYGVKRAFGVAWAADIKRSFFLQEHGYHTDYTTIPYEITPLNRIIIAEKKTITNDLQTTGTGRQTDKWTAPTRR